MKLITTTLLLVFFLTLSPVNAQPRRIRGSETGGGEMRRHLSGKGKGKGKSGKSCTSTGDGKGGGMGMNRPTSLTFRYTEPAGNSMYQDDRRATCRADNGPFPQTAMVTFTNEGGESFIAPVNAAQSTEFTIAGPFAASSTFSISGYSQGSCEIHTSCSQPLVAGDMFGPFQLVTENACSDDPPESEPEECVICDSCNKQRPPSITLSYSSEGLNSMYQDEGKASCRMDTYPTDPPYIEVLGKNGDFREKIMGPFSNGRRFTIDGTMTEFDSETNFRIPGWTGGDGSNNNECFFHTSCSQPLVVGDRIGPFNLHEGNECFECIVPDKGSYDCGEPILVQFQFDDPLPDDHIGIYPCSDTEYNHAFLFRRVCTDNGVVCTDRTVESGTVVFDGVLPYNEFGPHFWPIPPFNNDDGTVNRCYKAVFLREGGVSTPPYTVICESAPFDIWENDEIDGCSILGERP